VSTVALCITPAVLLAVFAVAFVRTFCTVETPEGEQ
jgi:hypothetical protein